MIFRDPIVVLCSKILLLEWKKSRNLIFKIQIPLKECFKVNDTICFNSQTFVLSLANASNSMLHLQSLQRHYFTENFWIDSIYKFTIADKIRNLRNFGDDVLLSSQNFTSQLLRLKLKIIIWKSCGGISFKRF
jgi:hypothetical protein